MSHLDVNTLWDYAHASLEGDDVAQVTAHLHQCASCQAQLDDIRGAQSLLSQLPEPPPMPDAIARRVGTALTEHLEEQEARRLTSWWPFSFNVRWVLVGAAAAAALAFAVVSLNAPETPAQAPSPPPLAQQDTPAPKPELAPAPTPEVPKEAAKPLTVRVARAKKASSKAGALAKAQVLDQGATVTTQKGGSLWLDLPDGTKAGLMGGSQVALATLTKQALTLDVAKGDLAMVVPHREDRLLTVRAGDVEVLDLGTRFLVSRDGARVLVAVSEGKVEVRTPGATRTVTAGNAVEWKNGSLSERAFESTVKPTVAAAPESITSNARLGGEDDEVVELETPDIPEVGAPGQPLQPQAVMVPDTGVPDEGWSTPESFAGGGEVAQPPDEAAPPVPPEGGVETVQPRSRKSVVIQLNLGDLEREVRKLKRHFEAPFAPVDGNLREAKVRHVERLADEGDCEGVLLKADAWLRELPGNDAREPRLRHRVLTQKVRCLNHLGRADEAAEVGRQLAPR